MFQKVLQKLQILISGSGELNEPPLFRIPQGLIPDFSSLKYLISSRRDALYYRISSICISGTPKPTRRDGIRFPAWKSREIYEGKSGMKANNHLSKVQDLFSFPLTPPARLVFLSPVENTSPSAQGYQLSQSHPWSSHEGKASLVELLMIGEQGFRHFLLSQRHWRRPLRLGQMLLRLILFSNFL